MPIKKEFKDIIMHDVTHGRSRSEFGDTIFDVWRTTEDHRVWYHSDTDWRPSKEVFSEWLDRVEAYEFIGMLPEHEIMELFNE